MKFKNENFNELYDFMKKMDTSDNFLTIQVSAIYTDETDMKIKAAFVCSTNNKDTIDAETAELILIMAMLNNDTLKHLITNAAKHYKKYENSTRMQKS